MEEISPEELADLLAAAHIDQTHDLGHILVHVCRATSTGEQSFIVLNHAFGRS